MRMRLFGSVFVALVCLAAGNARAADEYSVDPAHSCAYFKIQHMGMSWIYGRFGEYSGDFTIDESDPGKCSFTWTAKADSIDTNVRKRDDHLRSPDFFNARQFPAITFQSTSVKAVDGGYEVSGNLTMHGVTKPITITLKGGKKAEFPRGKQRTGYYGDVTVKRTDFEIGTKFPAGMLGDDVLVAISFEGVRK